MPPICSLSISLTKSDRRCGSAPGADLSGKVLSLADGFSAAFANPLPSLAPMDLLIGIVGAVLIRLMVYCQRQEREEIPKRYRIRFSPLECIILTVNNDFMDAGGYAHEQLQ